MAARGRFQQVLEQEKEEEEEKNPMKQSRIVQ